MGVLQVAGTVLGAGLNWLAQKNPNAGQNVPGDLNLDLNYALWAWNGTTWVQIGAGAGGPPTGAAGGQLGATYPNPIVLGATGAAAVGGFSAFQFVAGSGSPAAIVLQPASAAIAFEFATQPVASGTSAQAEVSSGSATGTGSTGPAGLNSGDATGTGDTGAVKVASGQANSGNTGAATLGSGSSTSGNTGTTTLQSGNTSGTSGAVVVDSGNGASASGAVTIGTSNAPSVTIGKTTGELGFYGVAPVAQQSSAAVVTVADLKALLINTGIIKA